jgi:hypothetical protein
VVYAEGWNCCSRSVGGRWSQRTKVDLIHSENSIQHSYTHHNVHVLGIGKGSSFCHHRWSAICHVLYRARRGRKWQDNWDSGRVWQAVWMHYSSLESIGLFIVRPNLSMTLTPLPYVIKFEPGSRTWLLSTN